jgi:alpha-D-xyloside xylohydrolase
MRRLTALAAVAVLTGCGGGSHAGISLHIDKSPFRVSVVADGKTVIAEAKGARLRYQLSAGGGQHALTNVTAVQGDVYTVATDEPGRTARVTVRKTATGARIRIRLQPGTGVEQVYDAFAASAGDHFLGGGERGDAVDLRGQVLSVKVSAACSYAPVPFFASSAGWGMRVASLNVAALAFPGSTGGGGCRFGDEPQCEFPSLADRAEVCVKGAVLDEDLYVGDFAHVLDAYQRDAGRPKVPPPDQLGLVKWRDEVSGPAEVLDDIHRLRAAGVPITWVLVDNPWETCIGTLEFDPSRFPDPASLIRQVHALGVRFMLWVSPKVSCGTGYQPSQLLGTPDNRVLDLTQPRTVAQFKAKIRRLVALGIDGVKGDRGDEVDLEPQHGSLHNAYPLLYATDVMSALPRGSGAIFRAAVMGSQRVLPGLWAGDQPGDWTGLERAIVAAQTAAMSAFPWWGSDIGGYHSQALTGDLFARWAQLGAVSPVMEVGGQGANATPWTLGADAMAALREAAVLHYELFPYMYGLLQRGEPVLRPLAFGFPDDPDAWKADLELLVGPDLVAAPVTGGGTTPSVYLPQGEWLDLHTGGTVKGPATFTRTTPLDVLPLYARAGTVIPFNLRTAESWWGTDELTHPGRAGFLAGDGATVDLRGQPRDVQLWVPASARPASVTLGGKAVAWSWAAGPLPGVVIRVHGPSIQGVVVLHDA